MPRARASEFLFQSLERSSGGSVHILDLWELFLQHGASTTERELLHLVETVFPSALVDETAGRIRNVQFRK